MGRGCACAVQGAAPHASPRASRAPPACPRRICCPCCCRCCCCQIWEQRRDDIKAQSVDTMEQLARATEPEARVPAPAHAWLRLCLLGCNPNTPLGPPRNTTITPHAAQPSADALAADAQRRAIDKCASQLASRFDAREGGFGAAPKFPRPAEINLLLHQSARLAAAGDAAGAGKVLSMATLTLQKMAAGGMHGARARAQSCAVRPDCVDALAPHPHPPLPPPALPCCADQLGGGFHRYSVDEFWHGGRAERMQSCTRVRVCACSSFPHPRSRTRTLAVPHFEIMLYDNPQLVQTYLEAFQLTGDRQYAGARALSCTVLHPRRPHRPRHERLAQRLTHPHPHPHPPSPTPSLLPPQRWPAACRTISFATYATLGVGFTRQRTLTAWTPR